MDNKVQSNWSNLPTELLLKISEHHLDTHLDYLRFRAICSAWRHSSTPPRSTLITINLPYPTNPEDFKSRNWGDSSLVTQPTPSGHYVLTHSTVYLLQPQHTEQETSWLVKLDDAEKGPKKFRVLSPVSSSQIKNVGLGINLLEFRFVQVCKAYYLNYVNPSRTHAHTFMPSPNPKKVLFFPGDDYSVVALSQNGRLNYVKKGDEEWTKIDVQIKDIVDYNGRLHSVSSAGGAIHYSSDYEDQTKISDWWGDRISSKGALLENCGSLFSVDIELDVDSCTYDYDPDFGEYKDSGGSEFHTAVKMKIYCLNEEKHKWEIVNSLGDRILFLGNDCSYSVSATHFAECKGNVVYHADEGIELQFEKGKQQTSHSYWMDDSFHHLGYGPIDDQFNISEEYHNYLIDMEDILAEEDENIDDKLAEEDKNIDDELAEKDENIDDEFGGDDDEPNDEKLIDDEFGGNEPSGDEFAGDDKHIGDESGGNDDESIDDEFGVDDEPIDDGIHVDVEPYNDEIGIGGEGIDEPVDDDFGGYGPNYWMDNSSSDNYFQPFPRKAYANVRGASDDVLKGLQGQNIGVFDVQTQKLGSLLMFREGASIFWPTPAWLKNNQN